MISVDRADVSDYLLGEQLGLSEEHRIILYRAMLSSSLTWIGRVDGVPACMWGLVPASLLSDVAYLWLVTTDLVEEHQFLFVRHSQMEIKKMLAQYRFICGHCDRRKPRTVRWIKWLGGKFDTSHGSLMPFTIGRD